jgi:hypothetical protein
MAFGSRPSGRALQVVVLVTAVLATSGCAVRDFVDRVKSAPPLLASGVGLQQDPVLVTAYTDRQTQLFYAWARDASLGESHFVQAQVERKLASCPQPSTGTNTQTLLQCQEEALRNLSNAGWRQMTLAGMNYIDGRCEAYFQAMRDTELARATGTRTLSTLGAATATLAGLAEASTRSLATIGAAFGLSTALFDDYMSIYLFAFEPGAIREFVTRQGDELRNRVRTDESIAIDRVGAANMLFGYITNCVPTTIAARVNALARATRVQLVQDSVSDFRFITNTISPGATAGGSAKLAILQNARDLRSQFEVAEATLASATARRDELQRLKATPTLILGYGSATPEQQSDMRRRNDENLALAIRAVSDATARRDAARTAMEAAVSSVQGALRGN